MFNIQTVDFIIQRKKLSYSQLSITYGDMRIGKARTKNHTSYLICFQNWVIMKITASEIFIHMPIKTMGVLFHWQ